MGQPTACMIQRMTKELVMMDSDPPAGICAWPKDGKINSLEATITGPPGTPYEDGIFKLEIHIPDRYPFEPPKVKFITPIYHPNIDDAGRICLDTLSMPPKGAWVPSLNICGVLKTIQALISTPNPDDPLMADINDEYKHSRQKFNEKAKKHTQTYAKDKQTTSNAIQKKPQENKEESSESSESEDEIKLGHTNNQSQQTKTEKQLTTKQLDNKSLAIKQTEKKALEGVDNKRKFTEDNTTSKGLKKIKSSENF